MDHSTIHQTRDDLDQLLAEILSQELGYPAHVVDPTSHVATDWVKLASADPSRAQITKIDETATVSIALPAGGVAVWQVPADEADRSGRHGKAILELHQFRAQNQQLNAEIDSLAAQVMNDFEELSLIRALASSMELPESGNELTAFVLRALCPMTQGVGAQSIAAVFTDNKGNRTIAPIWSNDALLSTHELNELLADASEEAELQPVVRNNLAESDSKYGEALREFVVVQCKSEGRMHGWIVACNRVSDEEDVPWAQLGFTTVQASLLETVTNQLAAQLHNLRLLKQKEDLFTEVVRALVNAVEARDPYTCGHSERVASFAKRLASLSGQSCTEVDRVYLTGLLHDVGKIAIPDGVLQKPGHLNDEERAIIETHTDAGWRILHGLDALEEILPGVLYHHEHYNGKGYPDGLAGENIPIDGRILAVCDAFDAMTSDRPYRKGMSSAKACEILKVGAGAYWDPKLIDVFLENLDQFDEIRINHKPREQATRHAPVGGIPAYVHQETV